jgi:hypothetical protein
VWQHQSFDTSAHAQYTSCLKAKQTHKDGANNSPYWHVHLEKEAVSKQVIGQRAPVEANVEIPLGKSA